MARDSATILGAGGFIGSALVTHMRGAGLQVNAPVRADIDNFSALKGPLGHVVYCIGVTSDFRTRPYDTVNAHVGVLSRVLETCDFNSLTYLSSTRVYVHAPAANEDTPIVVDPRFAEDLFNLSKLTGEALCLASGRPCRIARVSNVFGEDDPSDNFLTSILREAAVTGKVTIGLSPESAKDYVDLRDVSRWLGAIATSGTQRVYNVASGRNTTNAAIASALRALGIDVQFQSSGREISFPAIDVSRLNAEFGAATGDVIARLPELLNVLKHQT
ncbi:MAG: NAD-dependent epimerase/dehydratase family protein [Micropepsaceae bacterium]